MSEVNDFWTMFSAIIGFICFFGFIYAVFICGYLVGRYTNFDIFKATKDEV